MTSRTDSIYSQEGQTWKHQFASIHLAAWTATVGKLREGANALVDCKGYTPGGCRAVMFLDVVADVGEIAG